MLRHPALVRPQAYEERSAEAMFDLGFMHEFGLGVPKDLHLARRFYLMAKHTQPGAVVPVYLAVSWLQVHAWWDALRPHLPDALVRDWAALLQAVRAHAGGLGARLGALQAGAPTQLMMHAELVVGRWLAAAGAVVRGVLGGGLEGGQGQGQGQDAGETATLLGLIVVLGVVLRLRQQRAMRRAQVQGNGPAADAAAAGRGGGGGAGGAAAGLAADGAPRMARPTAPGGHPAQGEGNGAPH